MCNCLWGVKVYMSLKMTKNKEKVLEFLNNREYSFIEPIFSEAGGEFIEYTIDRVGTIFNENAKYVKPRKMLENFLVYIFLYITHILTMAGPVRQIQTLLKDEVCLRLLGFSEDEIKNGVTKRKGDNQYGADYERQSGAMGTTALVDNLAFFDKDSLIKCFNLYIGKLKAEGIDFGSEYALDSTIIETDKDYPGAKVIRKTNEDGEDTNEYVYGFKLWILSSVKTRIPVALHVGTANEADAPLLKQIVETGVSNIGASTIKTLLIDRGFINGEVLHQIKYEMGIDWCCPAKKNMDIYKDVTTLREMNKDKIETWEYGSHGLSGGFLVKGAVSYDQYSKENIGFKKNKTGSPINAVCITMWAGKEIAVGREKVIMTSADVNSAKEIQQIYKKRSLIENCTFRELKQGATVNQLPVTKKHEKAENLAYIHVILSVFAFSIFNAIVEEVNSEPNNTKKLPQCIREFRFTQKSQKANLFVLVDVYYAVITMKEFMDTIGFKRVSSPFDSDFGFY